MSSSQYVLLGLGNPLLDIQVSPPVEILEKYGLKANDAILVDLKHMPLFEEVTTKYKVEYLPGGAAQNAIRGAQYMLPPNSTIYIGCVGKDKYADLLRGGNEREGVRSEYLVDENEPTGKCCVILTGTSRSLVTHLAAANNYKVSHLKSPEIWKLVEQAKFFYIGGYHLTVCVDAIKALGEHAAKENKVLGMNLSAPFIPTAFKAQLDEVSPYWDYLIGNESEALAYAESHDIKTVDIAQIARSIANLPKSNKQRPRVVVITQGASETIVVNSSSEEVIRIPVIKIEESEIVDTNGAGDAFAGGFMASIVKGESVEAAVHAGHWLACLKLKQSGPSYPFPKHTYTPTHK